MLQCVCPVIDFFPPPLFFEGEFSATSDGSSPNTSAANTPDSVDALDESTDSGLSSGKVFFLL